MLEREREMLPSITQGGIQVPTENPAHPRSRCLSSQGLFVATFCPFTRILRPTDAYILLLILPSNLPAQHLSCSPTPSRVFKKTVLPLWICISLWPLYAHSLSLTLLP